MNLFIVKILRILRKKSPNLAIPREGSLKTVQHKFGLPAIHLENAPHVSVEKLQIQVFRRSYKWKATNTSFLLVHKGGKAANTSFPLFIRAEKQRPNLKIQIYPAEQPFSLVFSWMGLWVEGKLYHMIIYQYKIVIGTILPCYVCNFFPFPISFTFKDKS